jgi:hypothetical protein
VTQIKFKSGEYQSFTATRSFSLGALNVTVAKGSELLFDGSTVEYAGSRYPFPQLRSAVTAEWLKLSTEYDEDDTSYGKPVSANIKVRPPTDAKGSSKSLEAVVTDSDERIVMSTAEHAEFTREHNSPSTLGVIREEQDGVPVRALKTSAKAAKVELKEGSYRSAMSSIDSVQIDPVVIDSKEVKKTKGRSVISVDGQQSVEVAKIATSKEKNQEGFKVTQQVGGGIEVQDLSGMRGKVKKSTLVEDGIVFQNTNGPERTSPEPHPRSPKVPVMTQDGTLEARVSIARALCPGFPDSYNFAASTKKKIARLQADFENRPDVIKAVFAAESDEVKAVLVAEFPETFQTR